MAKHGANGPDSPHGPIAVRRHASKKQALSAAATVEEN